MRRNASTHKLLPENEFEDFKEWSLILVAFADRPLLGPTAFKIDHVQAVRFTDRMIKKHCFDQTSDEIVKLNSNRLTRILY